MLTTWRSILHSREREHQETDWGQIKGMQALHTPWSLSATLPLNHCCKTPHQTPPPTPGVGTHSFGESLMEKASFFKKFGRTLQLVGILVPWPGIEPGPLAVEAQSPNHWTTREFPGSHSFEGYKPTVSPFAWQSNKAILFFFTQNSDSEIQFGTSAQRPSFGIILYPPSHSWLQLIAAQLQDATSWLWPWLPPFLPGYELLKAWALSFRLEPNPGSRECRICSVIGWIECL